MKNLLTVFVRASLFFLLITVACGKPKEDNPTSLTIETSPATGTNVAPAPGPNFPLVVTITSSMPSGGVKIDVAAHAEGSVANFFSTSVNSSNSVNNFVITGAPQGVTSVVDVVVTDLSNTSLRATSSYRFAKK